MTQHQCHWQKRKSIWLDRLAPCQALGLESFLSGLRAITTIRSSEPTVEPPKPVEEKEEDDAALPHAQAPDEEAPWEAWQQYFLDLDLLTSAKEDLLSSLDIAMRAEFYPEAARLTQQIQSLDSQDVVASVLQEFKTALTEQDYAKAAMLRDEGGVGLLGWYAVAEEGDPAGHLLRVVPDFGRYVGLVYTPRDIAAVKGCVVEDMGLQMRGSEAAESLDEAGTPALEVFLTRGANGRLRQRACSQHGGSHATRLVDDLGELEPELAATDDEDEGGNSVISITLPGAGGSTFRIRPSMAGPADMPAQALEADSDSDADTPPLGVMWDMGAQRSEGLRLLAQFKVEEVGGAPRDLRPERAPLALERLGRGSFAVVVPAAPKAPKLDASDDEEQSSSEEDEECDEDEDLAPESTALVLATPQAGPGPPPEAAPTKDDPWSTIADQILHSARAVRAADLSDLPVSSDVLANAMRAAASHAILQMQGRSQAGSFEPGHRLVCTRINTTAPRTDPFTGLYLGSFGPHGPELVQLRRTLMEGEEWVEAIKLTGDANVPAGAPTFRARIGRGARLPAAEAYPYDLGVAARYAGQGHIAQEGYESPRWVPGELLQFGGAHPVLRGAELGFLWAAPGEQRYLILFSRIDLESPYA